MQISFPDLSAQYRRELFSLVLPFWERFGADHEYGGFLCHLDYDGTLLDTDKPLWYQGRGLWVYSYLYNHFGRNPAHLEIARLARDFLLEKMAAPDARWPAAVSRSGEVIRPYQGDPYGMFFAVEGLAEYAWASGDALALQVAEGVWKALWARVQDPAFQSPGLAPGLRPQGVWMCCLQIATPWLRRWPEPWVEAIAETALDAVVTRHYNEVTGLNREVLRSDFSCPEGEENRCVIGHSIECLWMAADEALRRGDSALFDTCKERLKRHFDIGWDPAYGGLADEVRVGERDHLWQPEPVPGSQMRLRFRGEHNWRKTYWSVNEGLTALLKVLEQGTEQWAMEYLAQLQEIADVRFSRARQDQGSHVLVTGREFDPPRNSTRQDNYHPLRRLLYGVEILSRLEQRAT